MKKILVVCLLATGFVSLNFTSAHNNYESQSEETFTSTENNCDPSTIPSSCASSSGRPYCACCPVVNGEKGSQWSCMGTISADMCASRAPPFGGQCYIQYKKGKEWHKAEKD